MDYKNLKFSERTTPGEIDEIYNFNVTAFADTQDFVWSKENIKKEVNGGWKLYSVNSGKEIICALFIKSEKERLLTKNTPIKLPFQGNGYSHVIKEFYENIANKNGVNAVINYCPRDNFRMISLNEGHDYEKTGKSFPGNDDIIEWKKNI